MSWRRLISRLLLLIVTLTIISPHFAWDAMAADERHEFDACEIVHRDAQSPETSEVSHDHHDSHTCSGHQFSHLPAQVSDRRVGFGTRAPNVFASMNEAFLPSRDLDTLERPPRLRLA